MNSPSTLVELILYACPTGPLAEQIEGFFRRSGERFGPNGVHAYPPHVTLTGFFHDQAASIPVYRAALVASLAAGLPTRPAAWIAIGGQVTEHGLLHLPITSGWLKRVAADFAARAASPTRQEPPPVKSQLHLSLAYRFRPEDEPGLIALARELVDPSARAAWELRLYERLPDRGWVAHEARGL